MMKKRFWALFLAVMMVVSVLPTSAFAEGEDPLKPEDRYYTFAGENASKENPDITLSKTAVYKGDGTYEVTLSATAEEVIKPKPTKVMFVLDASYSMSACTKTNCSHHAQYGSGCTVTNNSFSDDDSRWMIATSAIAQMKSALGEDGIDYLHVLFGNAGTLTGNDGKNAYGAYPFSTNGYNVQQTYIMSGVNLAVEQAMGDKNELDPDTNYVMIIVSDGAATDGKYSSDALTNFKTQGGKVYAVGFTFSNDQFKGMATDADHYMNAQDEKDLEDVMETITENIVGLINDPMGSKVDLNEDSVKVSNADMPEATINGTTINWTDSEGLDGTVTLTYEVTIKPSEQKHGTLNVPLNGAAKLNYAYNGEDCSVDFPTPIAIIKAATLDVDYMLGDEQVDNDHEWINLTEGDEFETAIPEVGAEIKIKGKTYWVIAVDGEIPADPAAEAYEVVVSLTDEEPIVEYTITYHDNVADENIEVLEPQTKKHDVDHRLWEMEPERTGYEFLGWNTDPDGEGTSYKAGDTYTGNADLDLYAQWKANIHKVTYEYTGTAPAGAPEVPDEANYEFGTTVTVAEKPALDGYTFSGWSKTGTFSMPDEDVKITGSWNVNEYDYTVEYYFDGEQNEELTEELEAEFGAVIDSYPDKAGDDYCLDYDTAPVTIGVDASENVIKVYYAKDVWNDETNQDDMGDDIPDKYQVRVKYVSNDPEKGTVTKKNGTPALDVITLYDAAGAYATAGDVTTSEATATATEGNGFKNWTDYDGAVMEENETLSAQTIEGAEGGETYTYTAIFSAATQPGVVKIPYYIEHYQEQLDGTYVKVETETKFDVNEKEITIADADYKAYANYTPNKTHEDAVLSGIVGVSVDTSGDAPVATMLTLKLYYDLDEYTVTYKVDGEQVGEVENYKFGAPVTIRDKYAKEGYTVSDWSITEGFKMPAENVVITATIKINEYAVTYYVDGEQVGEAETYQFGADVTVKDEPTKDGYDFFGWSYYPEVKVDEEGKFTMPAANVTISGYFLQHCTVEASKDVYQLLDAEGKQFWPVELEGDVELPRSTIETVAIPAVKAGETIIWKITVVNVGDQPGEFMLNELLTGVQVFADEACTEPVDLAQPFAIGAQGDNEATEYSIDFFAKYTVQEKDVAEIINKITVSGSEEPIVAPGVDVANIAVTKTADKTSVKVGDKITYTITVENEGTVDLANVKVTDTFVAGGKGKLAVKSGNLEIGKLAVGETATIVLEYTTVAGDVNGLKNTAVAEGSYDGEKTVSESDTEDVKVTKKNDPVKPVGPSKPQLNKADHYAYIVGYPDGLVHPEKNITRAEVATIFFRMLLDESREDFWAQENWFFDVMPTDWFNNAVSTLANANLINGYPDGNYRPNANITRAEFATIAIRFFLEEDVEITENNLSDVKGHWAEANIDLAYALNLINGYPDGTFRPEQQITRAEAMTIVNRVLERAPHKDHLLDDMIEWPDNMDEDIWYYADVQEATNSHEFYKTKEKDEDKAHEIWTELLPVRDWVALEQAWSAANSSKNPGEVVDIKINTP